MDDDDAKTPFYSPNYPEAPRQPKPGKLLFEFLKDCDRYRVELRDYGEHGVEAQTLVNVELWQACRFFARELAVRWAERKRTAILHGEYVEWP